MNVLGMLNLADICNTANIHLTTYATGCIFHYDKDFPENSGKGFTEEDTPNFTGSYYSYTKVSLDICALSSRLCMTCRVPVGSATRPDPAWDCPDSCYLPVLAPWSVSFKLPFIPKRPAGNGGEPPEGVPQCARAARAHAHCCRLGVPPQLHHKDHPIRQGKPRC